MPHKILVVDDEPDLELLVRQKFRKQIRDKEFEFFFAHDGAVALEKIRQEPEIDVVLSDINMPVMDGLTLLSRLNESNRNLKTVIVSAYGDMQNIRTAMNRGAFDFLTKPIDFQDFETTIHKTVEESLALRQGARAREQLTAIQHELGIAAQIQQSMLPKVFPAFPDRHEFSLYATMFAAKEVGGDFYDFFLIDPNRLGFVIGDVSGKGVPAAIFMAVSRTLLRATALERLSPGECLHYVNTALSADGETNMFVTTFYGVLHTDTGQIEFAVGGHNPPYLLRHAGVKVMEVNAGIVVGVLSDATYETASIQLAPGEGIVLYTDGVTEALDASDVLYSEERLEELLGQVKDQAPEDIVRRVAQDVRRHASGVAQSDDVTVMTIRYNG